MRREIAAFGVGARGKEWVLVSRSACGLMGVFSDREDKVVACVGVDWSVKRGDVLVERYQNAEWVSAAMVLMYPYRGYSQVAVYVLRIYSVLSDNINTTSLSRTVRRRLALEGR